MRTSTYAARAAVILAALLVATQVLASPARGATWSTVSTPNPDQSFNRLDGVEAISTTSAWAVGTAGNRPLAVRWNGTSWSRVATPAQSTDSALHAVDFTGTAHGWAVGSVGSGALIERWNGSSWTVVPAATVPGATSSALRGVKAFGSNDAWAVGHWVGSSGPSRTLIQRWNGTRWTATPSPSPDPNQNLLSDVDGVSSNDVWAIGNIGHDGYGGGTTAGLVLRWNGSAWSRSTLPSGDGTFSIVELRDITVVSSSDVWIVGTAFHFGALTFVPYVLRWNGVRWQHATIPGAPAGNFGGVAALSATKVYAFGAHGSGQPLVARWNGSGWSQQAVPSVSGWNSLHDAAPTGTGTVWGVGAQYTDYGGVRTLALRTTNG